MRVTDYRHQALKSVGYAVVYDDTGCFVGRSKVVQMWPKY